MEEGPFAKPSKPKDFYSMWQEDPSPANLKKVVDSLEPTIAKFSSSIGAADNPYIMSRGRVLAAKAVQTYNPSAGAQLHTWVSNQLQPLRRSKRESNSPVHIPEGIQLDAWTITQGERDFTDKHGRDPDVNELADFIKLPVERISKVRKTMRPVASESMLSEENGSNIQTQEPDYSDEALRYVYDELDYVDRKILEWKTGYGGAEKLPALEVAKRLKLDPSNISRRSAVIGRKILETEDMLKSV